MHHFPKPDRDKERFDVWKEVLDDAIKIKGDAYIYNQLRLCNKHFENYYISPSKCLTRNAVPTLYITSGKQKYIYIKKKESEYSLIFVVDVYKMNDVTLS